MSPPHVEPGDRIGPHPPPRLAPRERSAAQPASATPTPPAPLVSPTGNVALDALGDLVNRAAEPWQALPQQTPVGKAATIVNGVLAVLNFDMLVDAVNLGVGAISSMVPWPSLPAAVLGAPHIGSPHTHAHPPSLVPPAPPVPLPSLGPVMLSGCVSVLIGGMPAARASDLGVSITCGTLAPPFEVATGSSSVFIGGSRAARMGDITKHCGAVLPAEFNKIGAAIGLGVGALGAVAAKFGSDQGSPEAVQNANLAASMAAAQVAADTAKTAMAALMGKDPGAPPCIGALMMGNPTVLIGGFPIPPIENYARAFFQKLLKPLASAAHRIIGKKIKSDRLRNFFHESVCHLTGHPIDVASGRVLTSGVDLRLPGPIPLEFKRQYATSWSHRDGVLGRGWSHSYDQAVWAEHGKIVYRAEDGREIEFDVEADESLVPRADAQPRHAWLHANERWDRFNRLILRSLGGERWEIESADGLVREFGPPSDSDPTAPMQRRPTALTRDLHRARLLRMRDRTGHAIHFYYDAYNHLETIIDSAGRIIKLQTDSSGRLARIFVPQPTTDGWMEQASYSYSPGGDLVEAKDALGHAYRMAYEEHLLVRETNRNGLSFYFQYEGAGSEARCVKTWGDDGIYARKIVYDTVNRVTIVTDSLGNDTKYQMNGDNAVVEVTDALGAVTSYTFDESYRKIREKDPLGHETKWEYDVRGNCTKAIAADGSEFEVLFNERNQAVQAVDPAKGVWRWIYDASGCLIGRVDPLGRRVQFQWTAEREPAAIERSPQSRGADVSRAVTPTSISQIVDPAGGLTNVERDRYGNVVVLRTPDGAEKRWRYDQLGRCIAATDAKGNTQWLEYDAIGRVVRQRQPDGNVQELTYDPEGNVIRANDRQREVRLEYQGMGRLRSRRDAGTTVGFQYDKEERLIGLTNEHGSAYRFELDQAGRVLVESGFDGAATRYTRDLAGRVVKTVRPSGRTTEYVRDATGRVLSVFHSNGRTETFVHGPGGGLLEATNDGARVVLERDLLGRVTREIVGNDWVSSEYDSLGFRIRLRSSKGLDQRIKRNAVGKTTQVRTNNDGTDPSLNNAWKASFVRDSLGLEIERNLPGGVSSRWERDNLGRPIKQEVSSAGQFRKAVQYQWEFNERLQMAVDASRGPTWFEHDALGNLASSTDVHGGVELRMPDEIGNIFRTREREDRQYGPAGQLLKSIADDGSATIYEYDADGNLLKKVEAAGRNQEQVWHYEWNADGTLATVLRPDGETIAFTYDAFGRRLTKTFRGRTTRWIWAGSVPLHEWIERADRSDAQNIDLDTIESVRERTARRWGVEIVTHPPQGPPVPGAEAGTPDEPITWLFEPESFTPMAKLVGSARYAIVSDHLGTPSAMYDAAGTEVWAASIDTFGRPQHLVGSKQACPFRWAGQYEDAETGLYYNRSRYYDPNAGTYVSADPIRLLGGLNFYAYVADPLHSIDPFGLSCDIPDSHKDLYKDGAAFFVPASKWNSLKSKLSHMGYEDGLFVTTRTEADSLVRSGNRGTVKERLGIPPEHWNEPLVRLDVTDPLARNARMPTGQESGANKLFKPGGYTSGGAPEVVIDPVPIADLKETGPFFP